MELRLLSLYPDQMNIYADRGNISFIEKRCSWRKIGFQLRGCGIGDDFDPDWPDLIYVGGGQDRDQKAVAGDLVTAKDRKIRAAVEGGSRLLAVCGGYQLLGHSYELEDEVVPGLGLIDLKTVRDPGPRLIGPVAIRTVIGGQERILAGFENHGGRTWLGEDVEPLGTVIAGNGNNGIDGVEGAVVGNVIGTYLHGPLLPKNAWLADHLIAGSLSRRLGRRPELGTLDDGLEEAAHEAALQAALNGV